MARPMSNRGLDHARAQGAAMSREQAVAYALT